MTRPMRIQESFGSMGYVNQNGAQPYAALSHPDYIRTGTTCASRSKIPFRVDHGPAILTKTAQLTKQHERPSYKQQRKIASSV
ncbi:hypothetical protein N7539_008833 [Penicillium diatomitis]|uniref:Uncharacterized protein n=1 Tax=Penicillium diatomitis TaxID=2819901 RepID=A0A9X0BLN4_9EURO|nr:uncharacterized protein N7539_008833 [Penicillium diatomitis]KAJ5471890.1 hypothetical protein N7539_008833 [Penicillium diatomitis]